MTQPIMIGIEDGVQRSGTWARNGAGDSADQVPGSEADYLADDLLGLGWRSQDLDYANTRIIRQLDQPAAGRLGFIGRHNLSEGALTRLVVDRDFVERPVVRFRESGDLGAGVQQHPPLTEWSFCTRMHVRPIQQLTTPKLRFFAYTGGNFASANRQFELRLQTDPASYRLELVANDFGVVETVAASGSALQVGWHDIAGRYRQSDGRLELWIDGVLVGSATAPPAALPSRNDLRLLFGGGQCAHFEMMDIQLWGRWILDSEVKGYRAAVTSGTERGLVVAYHFTEGQGGSTSGGAGGDLALTAGSGGDLSWVWRVNPFPDGDSGVQRVWHDWVERQALRLAGGDQVETAATLDIPRSITLNFGFCIKPTDPLPPAGQDAPLAWFGTSYAAADLVLAVTDTGHARLRSHRAGEIAEIDSVEPVNDGQWHHVHAVLDGLAESLVLFLDGQQQGEDGVLAWAGGTGAKLVLGSSGSGQDATAVLTEVRLYSEARGVPADPWARLAPVDPELMVRLDLDGDVVDDAGGLVAVLTGGQWETFQNPKASPQWLEAARPGLRGADPLASYPKRRPLILDTEVEWTVALLQVWDRHNPDGWVSLGRFAVLAAIQPEHHRVFGAGRSRVKPSIKRTSLGAPYSETGASYDVHRFRLSYLRSRTGEADAVFARLQRAAMERPVLVLTDPDVEPHRLVDHSVWGIARPQEITDPNYHYHSLDITVEGVE